MPNHFSTPYLQIHFDGLVGPTHHYGGLSSGNLASIENKGNVSYPREAFLQGLKKASFIFSQTGTAQGLLPPQDRPALRILRNYYGWNGNDEALLVKLSNHPILLQRLTNSAFMWAANSATTAPSCDTLDGKLHIVPANLFAKAHRSFESLFSYRLFKVICSSLEENDQAIVHLPIDPIIFGGDEGAANHTRFARDYGDPESVHLFVYGHDGNRNNEMTTARQSYEASIKISELLQLNPQKIIFAKQSRQAIDQGIFHMDVAGVGELNLWLVHQNAFESVERVRQEIQNRLHVPLLTHLATSEQMSLANDAIPSYIFNSQIIQTHENYLALVVPEECRSYKNVQVYLNTLLEAPHLPVNKVHYFDLKQSMKNGGGPACLRLRMTVNHQELRQMQSAVGLFLDVEGVLESKLIQWCHRFYPESLTPDDLRDTSLHLAHMQALDELTQILRLPKNFYDFQQIIS